MGKKPLRQGFVVGEIFNSSNKKIDPRSFEGYFQRWLLIPAEERMVRFNDFGQNNLKGYKLPEPMGDEGILKNTKLKLMKEDQFWVTIYFLITKPNLCKKFLDYELHLGKKKDYLLYVRLSSSSDIVVHANLQPNTNTWYITIGSLYDCNYGTCYEVLYV